MSINQNQKFTKQQEQRSKSDSKWASIRIRYSQSNKNIGLNLITNEYQLESGIHKATRIKAQIWQQMSISQNQEFTKQQEQRSKFDSKWASVRIRYPQSKRNTGLDLIAINEHQSEWLMHSQATRTLYIGLGSDSNCARVRVGYPRGNSNRDFIIKLQTHTCLYRHGYISLVQHTWHHGIWHRTRGIRHTPRTVAHSEHRFPAPSSKLCQI